jgi:hypothetical protein
MTMAYLSVARQENSGALRRIKTCQPAGKRV